MRLKPRKELRQLIDSSHKNVGYMMEKVDEDFKKQQESLHFKLMER